MAEQETTQDILAGPLGPASPVTMEQAYHMVMWQLAAKNVGYAKGANGQRKKLHDLMRRNGWKGKGI